MAETKTDITKFAGASCCGCLGGYFSEFLSNDAILSHYDFVDVAAHQFVERPDKLLLVGIVVLEVDGY